MSADVPIVKLRPGGFVTSHFPGGFTDTMTGIHIPGTKVRVDPNTRRVLEVVELSPPIQLPHTKRLLVVEQEAGSRERTVFDRVMPFDEPDDVDLLGGLFCALQTGVIVNISDEKVQELFPDAWRARKQDICWSLEQRSDSKPMVDLIADAEVKIRAARQSGVEIERRAQRSNPPAPSRKTPTC